MQIEGVAVRAIKLAKDPEMAYSKPHGPDFWSERFGDPDGDRLWCFYSYEYIDDLSFMKSARTAFEGWPEGFSILDRIEEKWRSLGWDGDGEIQIMWIPPFAGGGPNDDFGCYALHVKQTEDGISWIASPFVLPFHRLFQPDDARYFDKGADRLDESTRD